MTSDFREEWVAIADDAHRLTATLLESALGDHAPKATKVALLAAYTPAAKGGLGIPAPLVEVAFAADRQALFDVLDDPVSMVDDIEDRQELVARRRGIAYDIMGTLLAVTCGASDLGIFNHLTLNNTRREAKQVRRLRLLYPALAVPDPPHLPRLRRNGNRGTDSCLRSVAAATETPRHPSPPPPSQGVCQAAGGV